MKKIIDVHCHLFNGGYALSELVAATWNLFKGSYPYPRGREEIQIRSRTSTGQEGTRDFAAYVGRLVKVILRDSQGNYDTLKDSLNKSALAGRELTIVPLMMDIYYALDDNGGGARSLEAKAPLAQPFAVAEDEKAAFARHLDKIGVLVTREMDKLPEPKGLASESWGDARARLDGELDRLRRRYLETREMQPRRGEEEVDLTPGYRDHMDALEDLARENPQRVLPFLALDPRRRGLEKLMELKLDQGQGIFKGVKLYPPLGYLPTHPNLEPVYEYCARYDIPITVHCSVGGFENFRKNNLVESWTGEALWMSFTRVRRNKSLYYSDPENWRPVLERWNNLRLNFGHFGGSRLGEAGTVNETWLNTIEKLMEQYPNVYADFSYMANLERKARLFEAINKSELLRQRAMFGSDFVMVAMDFELGGLTRYFDHYAELEEDILYGNASRFLKLS